MPPDRDGSRRARTLPDSVVYWLGVAWLAVSAALRRGRAFGRTVARTGRDVSEVTRHVGVQLTRDVSGLVIRSARSTPVWLAVQRTRLTLWAATIEEVTRRESRAAWRSLRADAATVWRNARADAAALRRAVPGRWVRRGARAGVVAGVMLAGVVFASEPLLSAVAWVTVGDEVRDELPPLAQTSVVVASEGTRLGVLERERRSLVDAEALPDHVTDLVLAAEDHRFADHEGYDLAGMARAALTNARAGEVEEGGSTVTQQLAKLNFTGDDTSVNRKVEELLYAVRLEDELSKAELLERYLNQVYFGSGAHGIAAAAQEYFARRPHELTLSQAATLAGIIQSPTALDPRRNPEGAQRRRDAVLQRAAEEGLLRPAQAAKAAREPLHLAPPAPRSRANAILDAVRAEARTIHALGDDPEERIERLETGGLRVETTLEPLLQLTVTSSIDSTFPERTGPTAAVAAVDPTSGAIRALGSGRDGPGGFDLARQGRRQPGSAFKPLTAIAALEAGLSTDQRLVGNGPIELEHGGPEPWRVDNFEGANAGPVDLRAALTESVNTAFAQLGTAVGPEALADVAHRLGIDVDAALGAPDQRGPSTAIGGVAHGVSPLELASAYTVFADDGRRRDPYLIQRIVDSDGDVVHERDHQPEQVVDPSIAGQIRSMLEDVLDSGTGRGARIDGVAAFGKTGTSQDGADAWFVGSTTNLTTAVWVGHPDGRVPMPDATGGSLAAPIWQHITATWAAAHPTGTWPEPEEDDSEAPGLPLPTPEPVRS